MRSVSGAVTVSAGVLSACGSEPTAASTETSQNRVLVAGETSFLVVGAVTASSPFTAFLNCAGEQVAVEAGTNFIAIKLGSLVQQ